MNLKLISTITFLTISSVSTWGYQQSIFEVKNFSGHFERQEGSGRASMLVFPYQDERVTILEPKIQYFQEGNDLRTIINNDEYIFHPIPSTLSNYESFSITNLVQKRTLHSLSIFIKFFTGKSSEKRFKLNQLSLQCLVQKDSQRKELRSIYDLCSTNATISFTNWKETLIKSQGSHSPIKNALDIMKMTLKSYSPITDIKNLTLDIRNHHFKLMAKIKSDIKVRIKMKGTTKYDSKRNLLKIKIEKIKAGPFSIKDKFFEKLKSQENSKFRVEKPYITIFLK